MNPTRTWEFNLISPTDIAKSRPASRGVVYQFGKNMFEAFFETRPQFHWMYGRATKPEPTKIFVRVVVRYHKGEGSRKAAG